MGVFGYVKLKKYSMGNRVAYTYALTDVQTTGSVLRTPFKKITGYLVENVETATHALTIVANTERTAANNEATLTFAVDAESNHEILVVGLL